MLGPFQGEDVASTTFNKKFRWVDGLQKRQGHERRPRLAPFTMINAVNIKARMCCKAAEDSLV